LSVSDASVTQFQFYGKVTQPIYCIGESHPNLGWDSTISQGDLLQSKGTEVINPI